MTLAASFYHLPPRVLPSIQAVEGGRPGMIMRNTNGSADLGLMQVNTIWVEPLSRYAHIPQQTVVFRLIYDPCFNVSASAAIVRLYLDESHGNLIQAVGYYHSHSPVLAAGYQRKVLGAAWRLFVASKPPASRVSAVQAAAVRHAAARPKPVRLAMQTARHRK